MFRNSLQSLSSTNYHNSFEFPLRNIQTFLMVVLKSCVLALWEGRCLGVAMATPICRSVKLYILGRSNSRSELGPTGARDLQPDSQLDMYCFWNCHTITRRGMNSERQEIPSGWHLLDLEKSKLLHLYLTAHISFVAYIKIIWSESCCITMTVEF